MHNPARGPTQRRRASTRRVFLRSVLGVAGAGILGANLTGCDTFSADPGDEAPHALDGFLAATDALGDRYDVTLVAVPALAAVLTAPRDAHRAHVRALAQALGSPTPGSDSAPPRTAAAPTDRAQALAALVTAEKSARDEAVAACVASTPRLAPLLGSIAAARASHLEVLK